MENLWICTWSWVTMEKLFLWRKMKIWRWPPNYVFFFFLCLLSFIFILSLFDCLFISVSGASPSVHLANTSWGPRWNGGDHWGLLLNRVLFPQEETAAETHALRISPQRRGQLLIGWERKWSCSTKLYSFRGACHKIATQVSHQKKIK